MNSLTMKMNSNVKRTEIRDSKLHIVAFIKLKFGPRKLKIGIDDRSDISCDTGILPSQNKGKKDCRSFNPAFQADTKQQESLNGELHDRTKYRRCVPGFMLPLVDMQNKLVARLPFGIVFQLYKRSFKGFKFDIQNSSISIYPCCESSCLRPIDINRMDYSG